MKMACTKIADRARLFRGEALALLPRLPAASVDAFITDPPYSSGGAGARETATKSCAAKYQQTGTKKRYPEFLGENRDQRSWMHWCTLWLSLAREAAKPGGVIAMFCDWRQLPSATDAIQAAGWIWRGVAVWHKPAARPAKGRYRNQAEFVVWGSRGPMPSQGPCLEGVWREHIRPSDKHHLTGKPTRLMRQLVRIACAERSAAAVARMVIKNQYQRPEGTRAAPAAELGTRMETITSLPEWGKFAAVVGVPAVIAILLLLMVFVIVLKLGNRLVNAATEFFKALIAHLGQFGEQLAGFAGTLKDVQQGLDASNTHHDERFTRLEGHVGEIRTKLDQCIPPRSPS